MTSPLEREILQHYYARVGPWKGGSENWAPADIDAIKRFIAAGYLQEVNGGNLKVDMNALQVYMDALGAVPLPERRWVIPAIER